MKSVDNKGLMAKLDKYLQAEIEEDSRKDVEDAAEKEKNHQLKMENALLRVGNLEAKRERDDAQLTEVNKRIDSCEVCDKEMMQRCDALDQRVASLEAEDARESETKIESPEEEMQGELTIDVMRGADNRISMAKVADICEIDCIRDGAFSVRSMKVRYTK